jgi:hypothetical protein
MGALIDNIAILNLGPNSGNYTRDSFNRYESTTVNVEGDDSWDRPRGRRSHREDHKDGHKRGHKG